MTEDLCPEIKQHRKLTHPIHPLIQNRWSSRAMSGETISDDELNSLFEAARWAPSSYNAQPWRFLYAKRETPIFEQFLNLLVDANIMWASKAAVLGVTIARKNFERNNKPSVTHAYDTGASWQNICLEGTYRNLIVHGMEGFDYEKAKTVLEIPDDYAILAMFAIGKRGSKESLPPALQERDIPSPRKEIEEFVMEGKFRK